MKRRGLVLIEDGSFTYDNRVKHETQALLRTGWSITVICPRFKGDPFYRRESGQLRAYFYPKPEANSLPGHVLEHLASLVLVGMISFWVFLRHGFDVIHACNPMDILWLIAWPYKWLGKRFIYDQHDLCPELFLSRNEQPSARRSLLWRTLLALERASYRTADVVLVTNESYREMAVRRGRVPAERVFVVRNGPDLDLSREEPEDNAVAPRPHILVGYLGNMNRQDGVEYLLQAARTILYDHRRPDIHFVLIGGGSRQPHLAQLAAQMGLQQQVTFTGRIPDPQMLRTLRDCDLCVQPDPRNALNDVSTMNKALEYMALAKPVVAFDLRETRVSCADAALYAAPGDAADLARQILALADDPVRRARLGALGRQRIRTQLAWPFSVPALLRAYERAMTDAGAAAIVSRTSEPPPSALPTRRPTSEPPRSKTPDRERLVPR
jgi:glycosyltransferase involved in cell wall biosynthesis